MLDDRTDVARHGLCARDDLALVEIVLEVLGTSVAFALS